jgi:hypothetical protein
VLQMQPKAFSMLAEPVALSHTLALCQCIVMSTSHHGCWGFLAMRVHASHVLISSVQLNLSNVCHLEGEAGMSLLTSVPLF